MKKLKILLLTVGLLISTLCLNAQASVNKEIPCENCFTDVEADYFLYQEARAYRLSIDSAQNAEKINKFLINAAQYKANEDDLKTQLKNEKRNSQEFKDDAAAIRLKYNNSQDKVKRRGGILIGSISLNVTFIIVAGAIIYFK